MTRRLLWGVAALTLVYGTGGVARAQTPTPPATHGQTFSGCLKASSDLATGSTLTPGKSTSAPLSGFVLTAAQAGSNASVAPPTGQSGATTTPPAMPPATVPSATTPSSAAGEAGAGGQVGVTPPAMETTTRGGRTLRIVGMQDQELKQLVNQQVEVRGMLESSDATATTGTTGAPTSSQPASTTTNPATGTAGTTAAVGTSSGSNPTQTASAVPTFRATSIRVLSANCSGGTE
jgi:hypothetical protein